MLKAREIQVSAPDRRTVALVSPTPGSEGIPNVRIIVGKKQVGDDIEVFAHPELLWAADSKAFAITWTDGGLVGNWRTTVYTIQPQGIRAIKIGDAVRSDLAYRFPPCVSPHPQMGVCTREEERKMKHDVSWVNVAAIHWVRASDRLLVLAQVPCSSGYGKNMCRDAGYEIEIPSGRVLARYSRAEMNRRFARFLGAGEP